MDSNPFTSNTFTKVWSAHFLNGRSLVNFGFIRGLSFYKTSGLPLYINSGKNLTKGISYSLPPEPATDYKNKVYLIYDVPGFFEVSPEPRPKNLGFHAIPQYPGFLINLEPYASVNDYLLATLSKSSRYKVQKYKKKLESCFAIRYTMYYGDITKENYEFLFDSFKRLLEKRFEEKQIDNNNLQPEEWNFYREVAYPMILEKKAALFVIYNEDAPISITLNYLSRDVVFDAITVFDIDYAKFHVGSTAIIKQLEWCIANKIRLFDFSKGDFDYKRRWAHREYGFGYHIYYDKLSVAATLLAALIKGYFELKNWLRKKEVHTRFHKLRYQLKPSKAPAAQLQAFSMVEDFPEVPPSELLPIARNSAHYQLLMGPLCEFLWLNSEHQSNLLVYQVADHEKVFIVKGQNKQVKVVF